MNTTLTVSTVDPMAIITPAAQGIMAMAMIYTMASAEVSFGASLTGTYAARKAFEGFASPQEELASLNKRITILNTQLERQKEAVVGLRNHKYNLMKEYKLYVLPSVVEMIKYPKLKTTDYYLRTAEANLDKMEVKMINMQLRRKQLLQKLGIVGEEAPMPQHYTAPKRYKRPLAKDVWGS
jgi:hypothetical protein